MKNEQTIKSYNEKFDKYISGTPNIVSGEHKILLEQFASKIGGDKKVLELGSAFLRDAKFLRQLGLDITCTDVIDKSVEMANEAGFNSYKYDFRDEPKSEWINNFDGVVARAVLLHATAEQFTEALKHVYSVLKKDGVFVITLKEGSGEEIENEKLDSPRYFKFWSKSEVEQALLDASFTIEQFDYIEGNKWLHFIVRK